MMMDVEKKNFIGLGHERRSGEEEQMTLEMFGNDRGVKLEKDCVLNQY